MNSDNQNIDNSKKTPEEIEAAIKKSAKQAGSAKLYSYNWLSDINNIPPTHNLVEVRFKNTRKEFFENASNLHLEVGDIVATEASPGHDIGVVSLCGELVLEQIKKVYGKKKPDTFNKIYRKAKISDIEKWEEAKDLEHNTMIKARQISKALGLNMKIGDVEYQGDKTKAIFYYIADERVDFRQLIKDLANEFKIRIEMRQIGARQEAGRIGGVGHCGRDLCCSLFKTNFVTVSTSAARYQELSLNPQKLAGQCGKLKCCLNYELASYKNARKDFPDTNIALEFEGGKAHHSKTDVYKRKMWYFYKKDDVPNFAELSIERVKEVIELNKKGIKPEKLQQESDVVVNEIPDYENVVGQESLTRFDKKKPNNRKNKNSNNRNRSNNNNQKSNENRNNPKPQDNNNNKQKNQDNINNPKGQENRSNQNLNGNNNNKPKAQDNRNAQKSNENRKHRPNNNNKQKQNSNPNPNAEKK